MPICPEAFKRDLEFGWWWSMVENSSRQAPSISTVNQGLYPTEQADEKMPQSVILEVNSGGSANNAQHRSDSADRSAEFAINLIQGKWKTRVLFQLRYGPVRMTQLRKMLPEASKKMLTQHLREMEQDGLIVRKDFSGKLRHVEYSLSHSRGFAALRLINTLATWSREHRPED